VVHQNDNSSKVAALSVSLILLQKVTFGTQVTLYRHLRIL